MHPVKKMKEMVLIKTSGGIIKQVNIVHQQIKRNAFNISSAIYILTGDTRPQSLKLCMLVCYRLSPIDAVRWCFDLNKAAARYFQSAQLTLINLTFAASASWEIETFVLEQWFNFGGESNLSFFEWSSLFFAKKWTFSCSFGEKKHPGVSLGH